mgnify:CR=1 FL=1
MNENCNTHGIIFIATTVLDIYGKLEITAAKKKDLTELCNMNVTPKSDWDFYQGLWIRRRADETTLEMYEDKESANIKDINMNTAFEQL